MGRPRLRDSAAYAAAEAGEAANAVENAANWLSYLLERLTSEGLEFELNSLGGIQIPKTTVAIKLKEPEELTQPVSPEE
ncbi:MAG TPA: hypothetical protein VNA25_22885 [Phycisphaerae bacterium]|nr:hypothetical protein [Phycisphaerae bacterium]